MTRLEFGQEPGRSIPKCSAASAHLCNNSAESAYPSLKPSLPSALLAACLTSLAVRCQHHRRRRSVSWLSQSSVSSRRNSRLLPAACRLPPAACCLVRSLYGPSDV
ncbi:uncharacterized protein UDID_19275 [Ustilago sp. UG-2017a]|nr:uncharacterized protein UDID_19275 [Ustilago sp. UG-2017a]